MNLNAEETKYNKKIRYSVVSSVLKQLFQLFTLTLIYVLLKVQGEVTVEMPLNFH